MEKKVLIIIPARYGSSRFPGKPLEKLGGREIILRVCDQVTSTGFEIAVATDDDRIFNCVENAGFKSVMTSPDHKSGTDRVYEAFQALTTGLSDTPDQYVVINVQGDEPFIDTDSIIQLAERFKDSGVDIATLYTRYPSDGEYAGLQDPNIVKLEINQRGEAMIFSRSVIPYLRGVEKELWPEKYTYLTHIGVYAYRGDVLKEITSMYRSSLEEVESLEQLRWLQAGYRIACVETLRRTIGIDTPADLAAAEQFLRQQSPSV